MYPDPPFYDALQDTDAASVAYQTVTGMHHTEFKRPSVSATVDHPIVTI